MGLKTIAYGLENDSTWFEKETAIYFKYTSSKPTTEHNTAIQYGSFKTANPLTLPFRHNFGILKNRT